MAPGPVQDAVKLQKFRYIFSFISNMVAIFVILLEVRLSFLVHICAWDV